MAGFTGWVALFTGLLVIVSGLQTYAILKGDRAFVAPSSVNFAVEDIARVDPIPIYLELQNSGKSSAFIKGVRMAIAHSLPSKPPILQTAPWAFPPIVAGGVFKHAYEFKTGWAPAVADEIRSGKLPLYIFGMIEYDDDTLLLPRITGFCFKYSPLSNYAHPPFESCIEPAYTYAR